jgi:lysophospholipase L1-like esterase
MCLTWYKCCMSSLRRYALLTAIAIGLLLPTVASAAARPLVAGWAMAPKDPGRLAVLIPHHDDIGGRTVRDVVRVTLDGSALRIRLSNLFGSRPLVIDAARVARSAPAGATTGPSRRLTFHGKARVTIPVGGQVASDVAPLAVRSGQDLAVSLYSAGPTGTVTAGGSQFHTNYVSESGDHTASGASGDFPEAARAWYFLTGVDVRPVHRAAGAVVAIGASITTGFNSTLDAYRGWVDVLGRRLHAKSATRDLAMVNTGIAGNNLHEDTGCYGQSLLHRLRRDALDQPGVTAVLVAIGSNELTQPHQDRSDSCIAHTPISATGMIADYSKAVRRIHARHLEAILMTIPPFGRNANWSAAIERERRAINKWMRTSKLPDGVVDAEPVLADPAHPSWLLPAYDSGDGLHPNDAGHNALARSINLNLFTRRSRP